MKQLPPQIQQEIAKLGAKIKAMQPSVRHEVDATQGTILELSAQGNSARIRIQPNSKMMGKMDRFR